jgi:hypothetical protein
MWNVESNLFIHVSREGSHGAAFGWGSGPQTSRTMTLGLTRPPEEMSTRNISWEIKAAGVQGWQPYLLTYLLHGAESLLKS